MRRRWWIPAGFAAAAFAVVALHAYLTPKVWEATTIARVQPVVVPDLQVDHEEPSAPTDPAAYLDAELAAARGGQFQEPFLEGLGFPATIDVDREPGGALLRFTARADTAERAVNASYSAANGYLAWGRTMAARGRAAALTNELAGLNPADPRHGEVAAALARAEAATDTIRDQGGAVVVEPVVPDDPVAPDLALRLVLATVAGLLVGAVVAWATRGRDDPGPVAVGPRTPWSRPATALLGVSLVAPILVFAALVAGVVSLWELRPTSNAADEEGYLCLPVWLADVPDGTVVDLAGDSPRFFVDHLQEFTFPRLVRATSGRPADAVLHLEAGPGPQHCAGYHVRWEGDAPWAEVGP